MAAQLGLTLLPCTARLFNTWHDAFWRGYLHSASDGDAIYSHWRFNTVKLTRYITAAARWNFLQNVYGAALCGGHFGIKPACCTAYHFGTSLVPLTIFCRIGRATGGVWYWSLGSFGTLQFSGRSFFGPLDGPVPHGLTSTGLLTGKLPPIIKASWKEFIPTFGLVMSGWWWDVYTVPSSTTHVSPGLI